MSLERPSTLLRETPKYSMLNAKKHIFEYFNLAAMRAANLSMDRSEELALAQRILSEPFGRMLLQCLLENPKSNSTWIRTELDNMKPRELLEDVIFLNEEDKTRIPELNNAIVFASSVLAEEILNNKVEGQFIILDSSFSS